MPGTGGAMVDGLYYTRRRDPALRHFVEDFRSILDGGERGRALLDALRPPLDRLLDSRGWLEEPFLRPIPGEVAAWALYRSHGPDLCLFTMVVPPGMRTRVHNHLTDGWVALLRGGQVEHVYRRIDDGSRLGVAELERVSADPVAEGELTPLLHPDLDIHAVETTSAGASVSLHVLANDLGTVERQSFDPAARTVESFVSGYSNVDGASAIGPGDRRRS